MKKRAKNHVVFLFDVGGRVVFSYTFAIFLLLFLAYLDVKHIHSPSPSPRRPIPLPAEKDVIRELLFLNSFL